MLTCACWSALTTQLTTQRTELEQLVDQLRQEAVEQTAAVAAKDAKAAKRGGYVRDSNNSQ
jgi:hypothetical protein